MSFRLPSERMAILEVRAARRWTLEQTAHTFQVTSVTIASWMNRVDGEGTDALVQLRERGTSLSQNDWLSCATPSITLLQGIGRR